MPATTFTGLQSSICFFLIPLLLPLTTIANNFEIYRSGFQDNQNDVFMTSEGVCNASSPSCHDYNAVKVTCDKCECTDVNETFGYLDGSWKCFGRNEIRQASGCFVFNKHSTSNRLDVLSSNKNLIFLNVSQQAECTYEYSQDTYMNTCEGKWLTVGNVGSHRYELIVDKRTNPLRYRYWIKVQTDVQANRVFEGHIMKVNFRCKQAGLTPWSECFVFKELYVTKPVKCSKSFTTPSPPVSSGGPYSSLTRHKSIASTSASITATLAFSTTTADLVDTTENSAVTSSSNSTYYGQSSKGARIHQNVIIGVSAAGGGVLLLAVVTICICCCRKRKRQDISNYTAALYDSSQDQCSAGIYAETSIRLPSTSKSLSLTSHSNPSYERGNDMSIKLTASRKLPSPSPTKSSPPRLEFSNESFEDDNGISPSARAQDIPRSPVKQRGNMLVKYENVTILSDIRPESVPDAGRFYDNPGDQPHNYHVLEDSESAPSYGELNPNKTEDIPSSIPNQIAPNPGNSMQEQSSTFLTESAEQTLEDDVQNVADEPIYANTPVLCRSGGSSPDKVFVFEGVGPTTESESRKSEAESNKNSHDKEQIYENSDFIKSAYAHKKAVDNVGYESSDEDDDDDCHDDGDDKTHKIEPIYEKPLPVIETADHSSSHTGGSPLLRSKSDDTGYQELKSVNASNKSEYQSLTPVVERKGNQKPKTKPKPKRRAKK